MIIQGYLNMKNFKSFCQNKLKRCGCKFTSQRGIIIDLLNNKSGHLSAEEIFFELKSKYNNIGLTTVYRTLELLVQNGILNKFDFGDGRARYELISETKHKNHHHHLVCSSCKKIIDYNEFINEEIELLKKTEKALEKKYNFVINNHLIHFYGLCKDCQI